MQLYVGNLSYRTTENDVRKAFEKHGTVETVSMIIDNESGRSKGFAFVQMNDRDEANAAISELDGTKHLAMGVLPSTTSILRNYFLLVEEAVVGRCY
ncbi:MAG: RNA recognition motif domain-containing protein [Thermoguttaceae bacterium]